MAPLIGLICLTGLATACGGTGAPPDGGPSEPPTGAPSRTSAAPPPSPSSPPPPPPSEPAAYSDFDGDQTGDLVLADPTATVDGLYSAGLVTVVPGSPDGPDPGRHRVITQNSLNLGKAGQGGNFGGPVRSADLDADGYADLITAAGRDTVFVVRGGKGGLGGGAKGGARLSGSAPVTGDFDGDGYADLVTAGQSPSTATLSYGPFSRAGAPSATVPLDLTPKDPGPDPTSDAGSGPYYTARLAAAGDVNGDGRDDLVVTWTHVFADEMPVPRATAVHHGTARDAGDAGGAGGVSAAYKRLKDTRGRDIYGSGTLTADVDKDGAADVIVGPSCEIIGEEQLADDGSRLTVVYGGPAGRGPTLKPTTIDDRTPGLPGAPVSTGCGFGSAPTAGDVNGDGYADVAFTAPTEDDSAVVLVLRGGKKGLTGTGAQHIAGLTGAPRLALLDMDGDGAAELAIGATAGDGGVRVLHGGPNGLTGTGTGSGSGSDSGPGGWPRRIDPTDLGLTTAPGDNSGWDFGH
ncbi:FG-GAP and VCBS repeat-containing protein [Streptomyces sp. JV176]|uniref:FG-GAP and VCBS repeat-containing protein n=1 Tax=Streptomyces sp. JV176 TaxID=858630 RepID=UPI002E7925F4|nr:FG-GAP and VCBS repeat-containing protein [Streptomyces sp. JV176]MEE1799845.1 FG-GAP and VCBS repeat-containing protein [Streptomyces sp. JV176]